MLALPAEVTLAGYLHLCSSSLSPGISHLLSYQEAELGDDFIR